MHIQIQSGNKNSIDKTRSLLEIECIQNSEHHVINVLIKTKIFPFQAISINNNIHLI